jgi:hypothetical protein
LRLRHEVQDKAGDTGVEPRVLERQGLRVSLAELCPAVGATFNRERQERTGKGRRR